MRIIRMWVAALLGALLLAAAQKVDLNKATREEILTLPGVGAVYAKKIVSARPYRSVADLAKARIPKRTLDQIAPLVTVGVAAEEKSPNPKEPAASGTSRTVWVNFDSKTYHFSNERWYGKTKNGAYMSEAQAKAQGYKAANGK